MPPFESSFDRKAKTSKNKLCSMREAISQHVNPGESVAIEGFTHLICFSAGHELIRQNKKDLVAIRLTPDLVYDQMIEAGIVKKLVFSWAGNPGVGSLHALRRKLTPSPSSGPSSDGAEAGLELEEYSHFGMVARFLAGSAGLPFWPLSNFKGTDLPGANPSIRSVRCPYTQEEFATVPALHPDVAIIHCQRADPEGNAQAWGLLGTQKEAAFASKRVIVVAEEIIDTAQIRRDPNRTVIPGILVDAVVHEPWGCHPSYVQGFYDRDNDFYVAWEKISKDPETYQDYLSEFVFGVKTRQDYLKKMDSMVLERLKAKALFCEGVNYGF